MIIDVCRSSPAPALLLRRGVAHAANPAALAWGPTAGWQQARWQALGESVLRMLLEERSGGRDGGDGESTEFGLSWRAAAAGDESVVVWLFPAAASKPPAIAEADERERAAELSLRLLTEMSGIGTWSLDPSSQTMSWDGEMGALMGTTQRTTMPVGEAVPRALQRIHPQDRELVLAGLRRVREPDFESGEWSWRVVRDDGALRWFVSRVRRLPASRAVAGVIIDVTEQHDALTELKHSEELRHQQLVAEESNRAKGRFLANMSHEIRTPMNAILGMAHLALRAGLDARQRNYVAKIERSARTLLGVINDILDFSKIDADKIDLEHAEFQLADVLDDVANLIGLQTENKGLELVFDVEPDLPAALVGDALRLSQVLVNLASNAVKFTERGEIVLAVQRVAARAGGIEMHFSVSDSGVGMTPQELERVFQPFEQADASTSRQHGGTGLGLAISQRLVQTMGGRLDVTSTPGLGSRFGFELPFELPPGAAAFAPVPYEGAGERVLVVDDNDRAREVMIKLCEVYGLRAEGAASLAAARRAIARDAGAVPWRLVLLDADLPDVEQPGIDSIAWVSQVRAAGAVTVLSCTALGLDRVAQRLAAAGLQAEGALLVKPALPSATFSLLARALGHRSETDDLDAALAAADRPAPVHHMPGLRVLLVDDHEINQELACEILRAAGILVSIAENGREAVERLQREPFDLVLMDCQMPVMDGYEATLAIRCDPALVALPIIAMTANVMSGDRDRALASGMNDVITKPVDIDAMFETIARWMPARG